MYKNYSIKLKNQNNLNNNLKSKIFGQDEAINSLVNYISIALV